MSRAGAGAAARIDIGGDEQDAANLQDRFKKFLSERKKAIKKREETEVFGKGRSEEELLRLRNLFVDKVKSYMGVPYGAKYHTDPSSPHFQAHLYLDCCGLVRQVLRDMKDDLGFSVGRGNQAYQFDTLPIRFDNFDKLKPGDLVFYEGVYVKEGVKPQKHDMVHVEVFMGGGPEGESTIGARWNRDVVKEFDTFRFEPKAWALKKHYFCSIETWLQGICRSFCDEHTWIQPTWEPGKFSIFAGEEGEGEGDEAADAVDDEGQALGKENADSSNIQNTKN